MFKFFSFEIIKRYLILKYGNVSTCDLKHEVYYAWYAVISPYRISRTSSRIYFLSSNRSIRVFLEYLHKLIRVYAREKDCHCKYMWAWHHVVCTLYHSWVLYLLRRNLKFVIRRNVNKQNPSRRFILHLNDSFLNGFTPWSVCRFHALFNLTLSSEYSHIIKLSEFVQCVRVYTYLPVHSSLEDNIYWALR